MPTHVVMPQMGESIAEGTIVRWIKKVGDAVDRDEPLFEISTDKVDAEIPSPAAGVLAEIRAQGRRDGPGQQRRRGHRRGRRGRRAGAAPAAAAPRRAAGAAAPGDCRSGRRRPRRRSRRRCRPRSCRRAAVVAARPPDRGGAQRRHRRRSQGSGVGGRVTKHDILAFIEGRPGAGSCRRDADAVRSRGEPRRCTRAPCSGRARPTRSCR